MSIWEAMEKLSELVDDSDPDVSVFHYRRMRFLALVRSASCLLFETPFIASTTLMLPGVSATTVRVGILISCVFPSFS